MSCRFLRWFSISKISLLLFVVSLTVIERWQLERLTLFTVTKPRKVLVNNGINRVALQSDEQFDLRKHQLFEIHHKMNVIQSVFRPNSDQIRIDTNGPVVNPHPFKYVINNPHLCASDEQVFLLNYIHTSVEHFHRRQRIRGTWADKTRFTDVIIKTIFVVGLSGKSRWLQDALEYEAKQYGDIVQEDFVDTYKNLSFKGIAALKWITAYCNQTTYVLKADDDIFVNIFALIKHLKDIYSENYRSRLIICLVWWKMHVLREGKWGIPKEQLPDDLYPVYCSGMGFVITIDVAIALYRVSYYVKFHWVDDAYISGFLPRALNGAVNHTEMSRAYCGASEMGVYSHHTEWYKYVFTHVHDEGLYRQTWNKLADIASRQLIPRPTHIRPGLLADNYIPKDILFPENRKKREQRAVQRKRKKELDKVRKKGMA